MRASLGMVWTRLRTIFFTMQTSVSLINATVVRRFLTRMTMNLGINTIFATMETLHESL